MLGTSGSLAIAADSYPDRPIKLVAPFAPGGGSDLVARALGKEIAKSLGQPVIVENRPGAGTVIGTSAVARSAPDGYTLLLSSFAFAVNPSLDRKLPYDTQTAFVPVALLGRAPNVLVVRADSPYQSLEELIADAKKHPAKLTYGSFGIGSSAHLAAELLKKRAGIDMVHVPYQGAGPAMNELLAGQIHLIITTASSASGGIASGRLRALAVTSAERSPQFPGVPTFGEAGVKNYATEAWHGVHAPQGTPQAILEKLNQAINEVASHPEYRQHLLTEGIVPQAVTPQQFGTFVESEAHTWRTLIKDGTGTE